jgi:hypothetical protein
MGSDDRGRGFPGRDEVTSACSQISPSVDAFKVAAAGVEHSSLRNTLSMCVRTVLGLICSARCKRSRIARLRRWPRERVFEPLGMHNSSLEWLERFATNHARGHEWEGDGASLKQAS